MVLGWIPLALLACLDPMPQTAQGPVRVKIDKPADLRQASKPVPYQGGKISIMSLGKVTFHKEDRRMTFKLSSAPLGTVEVPPGLYGVRWNFMPKLEPVATPPLFMVEEGPFLKATVSASVVQLSETTYRVSCAIFDAKGRLLGTANHEEKVHYIREGVVPTMFREIELDFGGSKAYKDAAYAVFSISEPDVPKPADDHERIPSIMIEVVKAG